MNISALILFVCSLLAGFSVLWKPEMHKLNFKFILAFSGAYLFSSTILHLLPEAFELSPNHYISGCFVLLGFYFQIFIEIFSEGVEHGHIHIHKPNQLKSISLIIALSIHALLEGMIISHGDLSKHAHDSNSLLIGLLIHKVPETIALISVLAINQIEKKKIIFVLVVFSLASPIGVLLSELLQHEYMNFTGIIMSLVAGNFLYISTTIFFESNPDHKIQPKRVVSLFLGGFLAIITQYFLG